MSIHFIDLNENVTSHLWEVGPSALPLVFIGTLGDDVEVSLRGVPKDPMFVGVERIVSVQVQDNISQDPLFIVNVLTSSLDPRSEEHTSELQSH